MSITSGFFDSINGDRKYNSYQFSSLFSGLINDGVFMNIGQTFKVLAKTTSSPTLFITVGSGRAWLKNIWVDNDSEYPLKLPSAETLQNRYDFVVLTVDRRNSERKSEIKILKGTPGSYPNSEIPAEEPYTSDNSGYFILATIYRKANDNGVTQAQITSKVGTLKCPYITGILKTVNIDNLRTQWQSQFNTFIEDNRKNYNNFKDPFEKEAREWIRGCKNGMESYISSMKSAIEAKTTEIIDNSNSTTQKYNTKITDLIDASTRKNIDFINSLERKNKEFIQKTEETQKEFKKSIDVKKDEAEQYKVNKQAEFDRWFQDIKDMLTSNPNTAMLSKIQENMEETNELKKYIKNISYEDATKDGTYSKILFEFLRPFHEELSSLLNNIIQMSITNVNEKIEKLEKKIESIEDTYLKAK